MGYKPQRTLYRLVFEDPGLAGLEVTCRSMPVGGLLALLGLADGVSADAVPAAVDELLGRFAQVLVSWNVEDDEDEPVPATKDGLKSQDLGFAVQLITAYGSAMTAAPPPLPGGSASGATSPEPPIPMTPAAPSASPPSSPAQS